MQTYIHRYTHAHTHAYTHTHTRTNVFGQRAHRFPAATAACWSGCSSRSMFNSAFANDVRISMCSLKETSLCLSTLVGAVPISGVYVVFRLKLSPRKKKTCLCNNPSAPKRKLYCNCISQFLYFLSLSFSFLFFIFPHDTFL